MYDIALRAAMLSEQDANGYGLRVIGLLSGDCLCSHVRLWPGHVCVDHCEALRLAQWIGASYSGVVSTDMQGSADQRNQETTKGNRHMKRETTVRLTAAICALTGMAGIVVAAEPASTRFRTGVRRPTYTIIHHPNPDPPKGANMGHSVAVLDWNVDDELDIAAGAPGEDRTYVFLGPDFKTHEVIAVDGLAEGDKFGNKIAAGNLDGQPGDELVIAAPSARVEGLERAGVVWLVARGDKAPRKLVSCEPRKEGLFGNDVEIGDFNADGRLDVVASSPGLSGGPCTGTTSLFFNLQGLLDKRSAAILRNHQKEGFANFGHELAVCDWNADGKDDLCVGAIWNTNSKGVEGGGQLMLYVGPINEDGQAAERHVFEDNLTTADDKIVRWGMSIDARDRTILVGSPRKDVPPVIDAGMGFVFRPDETVRNCSPRPVENGILGYRARLVDLIGDQTPDIAFMSLPVGTYLWDGARPESDPVFFRRPPGAASHWCTGATAAQLYPGGKEELVLGGPRWSPPGKPKSWNSGRLLVLSIDAHRVTR